MNTAIDTNIIIGFLRCDDAMKSVTFSQKISNWIRILSDRGAEYDMVPRVRRRRTSRTSEAGLFRRDDEEARAVCNTSKFSERRIKAEGSGGDIVNDLFAASSPKIA